MVVATAMIYLAVSFNLTIDRIADLFKKKEAEPESGVESEWTTPEMELNKDVTVQTNELNPAAAREVEGQETPMEVETPIVEEVPLPITDEVNKEPEEEPAPTPPAEDENVQFQVEEVLTEEEVEEPVEGEMENYDPATGSEFLQASSH